MRSREMVLTKEQPDSEGVGLRVRRGGQQCGGVHLLPAPQAGASALPRADPHHPHGGLLPGPGVTPDRMCAGNRTFPLFHQFSTFSTDFSTRGGTCHDPKAALEVRGGVHGAGGGWCWLAVFAAPRITPSGRISRISADQVLQQVICGRTPAPAQQSRRHHRRSAATGCCCRTSR